MDDQENAIMNKAGHNNEDEDVDHKEYNLEHTKYKYYTRRK